MDKCIDERELILDILIIKQAFKIENFYITENLEIKLIK